MNERDTEKKEVKVNPYKLFGLPEDGQFTRRIVRDKMKQLVMVTHPDKPTGSQRKFNIVMKCYEHLMNIAKKYEMMSQDVSTEAIKEYSDSRLTKDEEIPNVNYKRFHHNTGNGTGKGFDSEGFNRFFDENRLDDHMSRGHGDWLKKVESEYETQHKGAIGKGRFQEAFEQERQRLLKEKRIVQHTGVVGISLQGSKIASSSVDDEVGSAGVMRISNGVTGVDLREALEVGVIAVDDSRYNNPSEPISLEKAQKERENIVYTEEEYRWHMEETRRKKKAEQERQLRIQKRQQQIKEHYQRVNGLLTN